jgi:hypothetical protein
MGQDAVITLTRVNPYRVDARIGDHLVAYAISDMFGWAVMARRDGTIRTVQRVDYGSTARRDARIGMRLFHVALQTDAAVSCTAAVNAPIAAATPRGLAGAAAPAAIVAGGRVPKLRLSAPARELLAALP